MKLCIDTQPPSIERAHGNSSRNAKKQKVIQRKETRMARVFKSMKETLEVMFKTLEIFISYMNTHFGTIAEAMARE